MALIESPVILENSPMLNKLASFQANSLSKIVDSPPGAESIKKNCNRANGLHDFGERSNALAVLAWSTIVSCIADLKEPGEIHVIEKSRHSCCSFLLHRFRERRPADARYG